MNNESHGSYTENNNSPKPKTKEYCFYLPNFLDSDLENPQISVDSSDIDLEAINLSEPKKYSNNKQGMYNTNYRHSSQNLNPYENSQYTDIFTNKNQNSDSFDLSFQPYSQNKIGFFNNINKVFNSQDVIETRPKRNYTPTFQNPNELINQDPYFCYNNSLNHKSILNNNNINNMNKVQKINYYPFQVNHPYPNMGNMNTYMNPNMNYAYNMKNTNYSNFNIDHCNHYHDNQMHFNSIFSMNQNCTNYALSNNSMINTSCESGSNLVSHSKSSMLKDSSDLGNRDVFIRKHNSENLQTHLKYRKNLKPKDFEKSEINESEDLESIEDIIMNLNCSLVDFIKSQRGSR